MTKLTNLNERARLRQPGRHRVADNLFLKVLDPTHAYWVVRYSVGGVSREISLGSAHKVTRADATGRYHAIMADVNKGVDPLTQKRNARTAIAAKADIPTFGTMADRYIAAHESGWKPSHRDQWAMTLTKYCADIRSTPVDRVDAKAVLKVLTPIWNDIPESASRLRGRIEVILASAQVVGWIDPDKPNPARWRGWLDHMLPHPKKIGSRGHHAAMPYTDLPKFMAKLAETPGVAAKALMFVVLTACRTSEVLNATWDEIDFQGATFVVPRSRMKMGVEHSVPLSGAALNILSGQQAARGKNPYIFPGGRPRQPLSGMAMTMAMRRLGAGEFTVHGFRSSFRDWAADTGVEFSVAEQCLAHSVGNAVTAAYLRSTLLERRRPIMSAWADFVTGKTLNNVIELRRTGA